MRSFLTLLLLAFTCTSALIGIAHAQSQPESSLGTSDPQNEALPGPRSLQIDVGVGTFFVPAFFGSNEYQAIAAPMVSLRYKDRVFLSVQQGLGVELIKTDHFKAGPVISFQGPRRESNNNPLRIAGDRSDALRGLGTVDASPGLGGFAEYRFAQLSARIDVRKQVSGSDGLSGTIGIRYNRIMPRQSGRPIVLSIGPRATFVDARHNRAYYGVTAAQSVLSGLPVYEAGGGLLSAGVGVNAVVPISGPMSTVLFAGYDRMAGDAARSPLVEQRGSRDQPSIGLGLTYHFGAF